MELTLKQSKALTELIATARVVVAERCFPEAACKEISEASDIVEDMLFGADIENIDWDYIDKVAEGLIKFGEDVA